MEKEEEEIFGEGNYLVREGEERRRKMRRISWRRKVMTDSTYPWCNVKSMNTMVQCSIVVAAGVEPIKWIDSAHPHTMEALGRIILTIMMMITNITIIRMMIALNMCLS